MAIPNYEELLTHCNVDRSLMEQTFSDDHLIKFATSLDPCEMLAISLGIPDPEIKGIMSQGDMGIQRIKLLKCWKQRCGFKATYKALVKALLQISRTDLAEKVVALQQSIRDTIQSPPSPSSETSLATPTSPASSSGIVDMSPPAAISLTERLTAQDLVSTLNELGEEFFELVKKIEGILEENKVQINIITKRFRMLPQSIRRRHQTDENYIASRQRILDSKTMKELFDNLTALKHWSYMMPETLEHTLKDVKIDNVHQMINKYLTKLTKFKANTKLRQIIGANFSVPDYCIELTTEVEGWEDKTIEEVENRAVNIMRRATYGGQTVRLGWKGVNPGSVKLTFILKDSVKLNREKLAEECKDNGVVSIKLDGETVSSKDQADVAGSNIKVSGRLWYNTHQIAYQAVGGRDVLIIAPDLPLPHPEAVARRPGQLTKEDKQKLQSQGLPPDYNDEVGIIKARHKLEKRHTIFEVKLGQSLSREEILDIIAHLLTTTQNDGVVLHYIGAGRRNTGDWCFEDGFITFRDIAQLYLRALNHNFKGRVFAFISDCSYSGCWVRDCMEFLDEQGVQPCGHKAREKGIVIKVMASCKSTEIPTEYHYPVSGMRNNNNTGLMTFFPFLKLSETQTTDRINSSLLNCKTNVIDKPCTLRPGLTWREAYESNKNSVKGREGSTQTTNRINSAQLDCKSDTTDEPCTQPPQAGSKSNTKFSKAQMKKQTSQGFRHQV